MVELVVLQVIVLDFSGPAFVVDIIWRISDHQIDRRSLQQSLVCFRLGAVAAEQTVCSQLPHITCLGKHRFLKLGIHIKVIIMHTILYIGLEQVIQFRRIKAGKRYIKVAALQIGNE